MCRQLPMLYSYRKVWNPRYKHPSGIHKIIWYRSNIGATRAHVGPPIPLFVLWESVRKVSWDFMREAVVMFLFLYSSWLVKKGEFKEAHWLFHIFELNRSSILGQRNKYSSITQGITWAQKTSNSIVERFHGHTRTIITVCSPQMVPPPLAGGGPLSILGGSYFIVMVFSVTYTICEGPKLDTLRFLVVTTVYCQYDTFVSISNYIIRYYLHYGIHCSILGYLRL